MRNFAFSWTSKDLFRLVVFILCIWFIIPFIVGLACQLVIRFRDINLTIPKTTGIIYALTPFLILFWHKFIIKDKLSSIGFKKPVLRCSYVYAILFPVLLFIIISMLVLKNFDYILSYNYTVRFFANLLLVCFVKYNLFSSIIVAPLAEELFFRSIIFQVFLKKFNFIKSLLFSTVIFAIAHIYIGLGLYLWATVVIGFIFGLFAGYIFYYSKSIFPSLVAHILLNFFVNSSKMIAILSEQGIVLQ